MSEWTVDSASVVNGEASGGPFVITAQVDLSDSYPTGGYDLTLIAAQLATKATYTYQAVMQQAALASGRTVLLDAANQKLIVLDSAGAEIANTTDLSAMVNELFRFLAI